MNEAFQEIRDSASAWGLNLVGAVSVERYEESVAADVSVGQIETAARSIILIGNGGASFWKHFQDHCSSRPGWLERDNPLDDFTRQVVESELIPRFRRHGIHARALYPFMPAEKQISFLQLAKLTGLGGPSIVGVLVHPTFGPWIAFRAAILVDVLIDAPGEASGFDPCPSCEPRSCIAACPVGAVSMPKGWDAVECTRHRVEVETDCAARCHSRVACVLSPEHRYPDDELQYHHSRALRVMKDYYSARLRPRL